ncbi:hypothetical protein CEXT_71961 [Caerostris extrusa]|uniref:Uncharacterized protein n=1 Tax=Caerostris extrusa TaxID=172846 RepID=A0AAV4Q9J7_CAEEX|nr:hypothetical protein CEXT_71961 [Caerostris extrusa]
MSKFCDLYLEFQFDFACLTYFVWDQICSSVLGERDVWKLHFSKKDSVRGIERAEIEELSNPKAWRTAHPFSQNATVYLLPNKVGQASEIKLKFQVKVTKFRHGEERTFAVQRIFKVKSFQEM